MTKKEFKNMFIVHTNGEDEYIRVDKRTFDKAVDNLFDNNKNIIKKHIDNASTQSLDYHDSTEVISVDSLNIILNEVL